MPLFNWGASSMRGVMTDHFWIYWAVTCPLTILVMGIVITFAIHQTRQNNAAATKARNSAQGVKGASPA
jgi:heme/copper-type cytochrome/quinol oxidase subunit 2